MVCCFQMMRVLLNMSRCIESRGKEQKRSPLWTSPDAVISAVRSIIVYMLHPFFTLALLYVCVYGMNMCTVTIIMKGPTLARP